MINDRSYVVSLLGLLISPWIVYKICSSSTEGSGQLGFCYLKEQSEKEFQLENLLERQLLIQKHHLNQKARKAQGILRDMM